MDKHLLSKVKSLLQQDHSNPEQTKLRLMAMLKPSEADEVYQYFLDIEPDYLRETCKAKIYEIIPQYNDYFKDPKDLNDIILDLLDDNESLD